MHPKTIRENSPIARMMTGNGMTEFAYSLEAVNELLEGFNLEFR
jgi:hypothetical protein